MSNALPLALLTADSPSLLSVFGPPQWGIFGQNGQPVLISESVSAVEYTRDYSISDYPQEQGAFESYNKVQNPFQAKVTLLSNRTRAQLLNTLEAAVASLNLVTVITPEVGYPSANLTRYSLRRTSRSGVSMIAVDIWVEEVRQNAGTQLSNIAASTGTGGTSTGTPHPIGQPTPGANLGAGSSSAGNAVVPEGTFPANNAIGAQSQTTQQANAFFNGSLGGIPVTPPSAINAASTNAASPVSSGPVQTFTVDQVGSGGFPPPM